MQLQRNILKLDIGGIPEGWINSHDAAKCIFEGHVAWSLGDAVSILHGGFNRHGARSVIAVPSIIAVSGVSKVSLSDVPVQVSRDKLFKRDRCMCAYCGEVFDRRYLEAEHIIPKSRGGEWSWMNLVAACTQCNQHKKKNRTPEEAGMPLLYLPYIPNRWESIIMEGRNVLADQMEFLLHGVPRHSRLKD